MAEKKTLDSYSKDRDAIIANEREINRMKNIVGDRTGFYPESLKLKAKKFIAENGSASDKKMLQRPNIKQTVRLGDSKVQRIGEYNENNSSDNFSNLF